MNPELDLLGRVAANQVRTTLDAGQAETGYARFLVHALDVEEVMALTSAIRGDADLAGRVEIRLPRYKYAKIHGVPLDCLTDLSATELRHTECELEGRVIVLGDDSQKQSVAQLERLDSEILLDVDSCQRWIEAASVGLDLPQDTLDQWIAALRALLRVRRATLRQVSDFMTRAADAMRVGQSLQRALGQALPALRIPRHDTLFDDIPPARRRQASQWQQRLETHWRRECYIAKRDPSQVPFSRTKLRDNLERLGSTFRDEVRADLEAYVSAQDGVSGESFALFKNDWSELETFFEEARRNDGRSLGQETYDFYQIREPELLTQWDRDHLEAFRQHRRQSPIKTPDDDQFYAAHAQELQAEPRLAALWERFIFGQRVECGDLLDGLVQCLRRIYRPLPGQALVLVVEGNERTAHAFLPLNDEVCMAFATWYRGLPEMLDGLVEFRDVKAFEYPYFKETIAGYAKRTPQGVSRRARQLTFKVWVEARTDGETPVKTAELRLVWECDLKSVGTRMSNDLSRLGDNHTRTPLVRCVAARAVSGAKGAAGNLNLEDVNCLEPSASRDRGCFVPARSRARSLAREWRAAAERLVVDKLLGQDIADDLRHTFDEFETAYRLAVAEFEDKGPAARFIDDQARLYGVLLARILDGVDRPVALERLLRPLLDIGVAQVEGGSMSTESAIVCPWHPLRMAALAGRWAMVRSKLSLLLVPGETAFTDSGALYFAEFRRALAEPARPDVVPGWHAGKQTPLSFANGVNGYSLHEAPVLSDGVTAPTSDVVGPVAHQISDLVRDYLRLQPHEKDNLSVVLYNSDAAALPQAVVDQIRGEAEREGRDAMCQVVLRHRDEARLRALYRQLVAREAEGDGVHASEVSRDFMARLRISLMTGQGPGGAADDGPPFDIVFCHDVISRAATLDWSEIPRTVLPSERIDPGHWSRRRPVRRGDLRAVAYLTCPAQPTEGWDYLDAIASLHVPELARRARREGSCLVPARVTDVQDPGTRQILDETHRLGSWVVNFDDLLDRRQLIERDIRIIRYRHATKSGRNLVISSKASDALLRSTLRSRIRALDPDYSEAELEMLSLRLVEDANAVSGDIVLRAAKRGANANELLGIVLSKFLVDAELGLGAPRAWLFLDDYAAWLGQDEKRIADLLCLAPRIGLDGRPTLGIVVTEAKYVAAAGAQAKASDSARQLRDTLLRLEGALDPNRPTLDRDIWLSRLSDMLVDGICEAPGQDHSVDWKVAIRDGQCRFDLRGYSHVFAHAAPGSEGNATDGSVGVAQTLTGLQELYSPGTLRKLLRCYADRGDPTALRALVSGGVSRRLPVTEDIGSTLASAAEDNGKHVPEGQPQQSHPAAPREEDMDGGPEIGEETGSAFRRLLARTVARPGADDDGQWLAATANKCRQALLGYGMSAQLDEQVLTPNAALLKFKGSNDLTVASVTKRMPELSSTHSLEILTVRSEPGRIVIYIKRPHRATLTLASVWKDWVTDPKKPNNRLLIAVREDDGKGLFLEPDPAPHTLVAGSTGSGKSVLVQNLILGIAATNRPNQARLVLIDPKSGVDYFPFEPLPHLDGGIIDDQETALEALEGLVAEMERRYGLFKQARVANIRAYNAKSAVPLTTIWLIHDEFADWMQVDSYRAGVEAAVSRLGIKARAAGIYLVFAAQRPDNTVFPMQLRSNLGNRLVLRVDSAGTSDLSIGVKGGGAERLLGKGHLAAVIGGATEPVYAQVPYVDEGELAELVEAICEDLQRP